MPRASHLVALNVSLGQWSFLMGAGISESKERALDVEQGDLLAFNVDQPSLTWSDLALALATFTNSPMQVTSSYFQA